MSSRASVDTLCRVDEECMDDMPQRVEECVSVDLSNEGMQGEMVIRFNINMNGKFKVYDQREEERFHQALNYGIRHNAPINELAEICCLSPSTFKRRFRERMGLSPHLWFVQHRMKLAHDILLNANISTTELARICCYNNTSYFISVFKYYYGTSPGRLKKSLQSNQSSKSI